MDIAPKQRTGSGQLAMLAAVLALMLVAGFRPEGYRFRNEATWIADGPGLRFEKFGIAYSQPFLTPDAARRLNQSGMTLLLGLRIGPDRQRGIQFVSSFHNGDDSSQLAIVLWRNTLFVMNGDDYDHTRKTPRVSADLTPFLDRPFLLAISTDPEATFLIVDGNRIGNQKGLQILLPAGGQNSRLTLGNSVHSNSGFEGDLYGFALLGHPLTESDLATYHDEWVKTRNLEFVAPEDTVQLLRFDEKAGALVRDASGAKNHAILPPRPTALGHSVLGNDPTRQSWNASFLKDVVINLFGFVPFGALLGWILIHRGWRNRYVVTTVILGGFAISIGIETMQAWIPTRSSSALDLLLNTLGAAAGVLGSQTMRRRRAG